MMRIERGAKRTAKPDVFISHSSRDKAAALRLATTLNFCSVDVWLDDWELELGQHLTDEIAKAMNESRFIAILITENYNKSVWTKTEYKKALAREQREDRIVLLPLVVGRAEIPDFLEDKINVDLRQDFFRGVTNIVGMVHDISRFRISQALANGSPESVGDVWKLLESIGFEPYVVLGDDDFAEVLTHGGHLQSENYATFSPDRVLADSHVSAHVKSLLAELD